GVQPEDPDEIRSAVLTLKDQAEKFEPWITVGLALFNASQDGKLDEDEAFDIWDEFSQLGTTYNGRDDCYSYWEKLRYRTSGPKVGIGSIMNMAKATGWTKPVPPPPPPEPDDEDDDAASTAGLPPWYRYRPNDGYIELKVELEEGGIDWCVICSKIEFLA